MVKARSYVLHKTIRRTGTVVGHGCRLVNGAYLPTLKVRLVSQTLNREGIVVEDLASQWLYSNREGTASRSASSH
jgi:hypothetical protein